MTAKTCGNPFVSGRSSTENSAPQETTFSSPTGRPKRSARKVITGVKAARSMTGAAYISEISASVSPRDLSHTGRNGM